MIRQFELVELVKGYDPGADEEALNRAYVFSMKAHGSQSRASGDPYFSHPLGVAEILTRMKLDSSSIVTALLHDTVEDTDATLEQIEGLFGKEIARLVDGVTKLSRLELQSDSTKHAENFRKLVLAMSDDIRVLLVKLADRLHNMQTLHFIKDPDKRKRIALETLDIYAPLAERIGMQRMKDELENLAFAEINPEACASIKQRLSFLREQGGVMVGRIIDKLKADLAEGGIDAQISGREKSPYSIWRKMQRKNIGFEQLSDIMAFRVVVADAGQCYQALGILHSRYAMVPGRFKDYISTPKPNNYRSLHTGVIGPERQRIEIQIRTRDMHEVAELGVAAHWKYKQNGERMDGRQYRWLRELLDILEHAAGPEEFLEHTKLEMFQDQVFCFTPKGDLIALPRGATPVDFAYAVHSQIGDTCVGAKVNGRIVPLSSVLTNGDQVEIVTSRAQTPSPTWERFVVTGRARARIRRFVRTQQRTQYIELGRAILEKEFRQEGFDFTAKGIDGVLKKLKFDSGDDLMAAVGAGLQSAREVLHAVYPGTKAAPKTPKIGPVSPNARARAAKKSKGPAIPIVGLIPGMALHFAGCCHPLPGDRIVGIVTTGKGVTIHTIDCESLEAFADAPERWLDVGWDNGSGDAEIHVGRLHVVLNNEPGSLGNISSVIGKSEGNISNLKITRRSLDFFEMMIDVEVKDVRHLTNIIAALRATPSVSSVERARG
ncbi:MAG TPA: bifunctional (p)ppGpp synthetase/guanosine-3',5'-bis(diphosphate) 3'-pyrophosphohydrolase [Hypericibacter adhaerens]|uniref:GTP pyrophosphokinase rsh n=1 Tax=Hypericibacter adhaerens TaxID=2602016 RepID=A0A5J6N2G0_9PROT|nr:bifunctional (p)ppGpp synthetase/guanosine-3',5'-bis(diphosphate) 3'-pyrophosphohydrolase [Hypericibacter adhaerens]QEX22770.1 GTP pyrophosphokinase [Hypericibacter adhaerens]HWA44921.1 bifunctional (p)ppGpp synthetase/guanosine-3',5'-bis(diphosphate) 3'-pyrophosphohydrolase [Hypericibacter adhaerens]